MNIGAVSSLFPNWAQSPGAIGGRTGGTSAAGVTAQPAGSADISPLAQILSRLQQIQQQNPNLFKQLAANVATRLQKAAQDAQSSGDGSGASELKDLATAFQKSAQSGQLPVIRQHHDFGDLLKGLIGTAGAVAGVSALGI
jgi:hypothetical protein